MSLSTVNGQAILHLSGEAGEMGVKHGELLRDHVGETVESYVHRSQEVYDVPTNYLLRESAKCKPHIPQRFLDEMDGVAQGSGVSFQEILALNCLADVDGCYMQGVLQCCNFVLSAPATEDELFCHGRNLDFPNAGKILARLVVAISRRPSSGAAPTLAIGFPGFVGMFTGYSAQRLTAAEVTSPDKNAAIEGVPIAILIRDALERAETTDQFFNIVRDMPRTCGYNLAVSDGKSKQGICIEMTNRLCEMRAANKGVLAVDNPCFCKNTGKDRLTYAAGAFRYARMMHLIDAAHGSIGVNHALTMLSDNYDVSRARRSRASYNCICNHHTIHSVLFLPAEGRLLLAHGTIPAPKGEYVEYTDEQIWK